MKSPGHSEMMPPLDSDMMSPRAEDSLAAKLCHCLLGMVNLFGGPFAGSAKAVSSEIDAVGVVDEAVEDSVGVSRIADDIVPFVDRKLAGDDRGSSSMAFFENFQQVVSCGGIEGLETPIVVCGRPLMASTF